MFKQVLIAFDQLVNALLFGYADETFSARCWRKRNHPAWFMLMVIVDLIFFWEENHCFESYQSELIRKHLPREYKKEL